MNLCRLPVPSRIDRLVPRPVREPANRRRLTRLPDSTADRGALGAADP